MRRRHKLENRFSCLNVGTLALYGFKNPSGTQLLGTNSTLGLYLICLRVKLTSNMSSKTSPQKTQPGVEAEEKGRPARWPIGSLYMRLTGSPTPGWRDGVKTRVCAYKPPDQVDTAVESDSKGNRSSYQQMVQSLKACVTLRRKWLLAQPKHFGC